MNPKSERKEQTLRSKAHGHLPLSGHRSSVLDDLVKLHNRLRDWAKMTLKPPESDIFAIPVSPLALSVRAVNCGIRVESATRSQV